MNIRALAGLIDCQPSAFAETIRDVCDRNRPFYKKHRDFLEWMAEETEGAKERSKLQARYARCFAPGDSVPDLPTFREKSTGH